MSFNPIREKKIGKKFQYFVYFILAGDSLAAVHHGQPFSTYDRDNDNHSDECAEKFMGAWWYKSCHASNLNGQYLNGWHNDSYADGINWYTWRGYHYSLKETKMMIRRKPTGT